MPRKRRIRRRKKLPAGLRALKEVRKLKKETKQEVKFEDTVLDTNIGYGGMTTIFISGISQGDGENDRDGNECWIKGVNLKFLVDNIHTTADAVIRVMLFQDMDCDGTSPTTAEILEEIDWSSFRNLENIRRFKVLHDKIFVLGPSGVNNSLRVIRKSFKMSKKLVFHGATGATTDARSGAYFVGFMTNLTAGGNPVVEGTARVRFTD